MGETIRARCGDCGQELELSTGIGFASAVLRCDRCGREKWVDHLQAREWADAHPGGGDYFSDMDRYLDMHAPRCRCGGRYHPNAPLRCTKCRSTNLEDIQGGVLWD